MKQPKSNPMSQSVLQGLKQVTKKNEKPREQVVIKDRYMLSVSEIRKINEDKEINRLRQINNQVSQLLNQRVNKTTNKYDKIFN